MIMADRGFVSYNNYEKGVMEYKIIPFIFPRKNMRLDKITGRFNYPLEVYKGNSQLKKTFRRMLYLLSRFSSNIGNSSSQ